MRIAKRFIRILLKTFRSFLAEWRQASDKIPLPCQGVLAGKDSDGDDLYVGRGQFEKELAVGKIKQSDRHLYGKL